MQPRRIPYRDTARRLAVAGLAALVLFIGLAVLVRAGRTPVTRVDLRFAHLLHGAARDSSGSVRFWGDLSDVFAPTTLRIASLVLTVALAVRRRLLAALAVAAVVWGTWPLSDLTKVLVDRDRPHFDHPVAHAAGQAYPSGHALTSFAAAVALLAVCSPRWRRILAAPSTVIVLAVGFSRLLLGVHYLSDVIGGWLLAVVWLSVVGSALTRQAGRSTQREPDA